MTISTQHAGAVLGNNLNFVQTEDGTVYVPLKRLCESLRIDYERERSKVRKSKAFNAELLSVPGADGRHRKTLCLSAEAVGAWASTIDPASMPPEVLEALRGYPEQPDTAFDEWEIEEEEPSLDDSPEDLVRILLNSLLNTLSGVIGSRRAMLQREIDFIEDVAKESPALRTKAQTYVDAARASFTDWIIDFQKDILQRLEVDLQAAQAELPHPARLG